MRAKIITSILFVSCLFSLSAFADKGLDLSHVKGEWKGAYIIDAYVNQISFNVFMEDGKWKATMDIPENNALDIPYEISVMGDQVKFRREIDSLGAEVKRVEINYTGTIKDNIINGTYSYRYSYKNKDYNIPGVFQVMLNPSLLTKHKPIPAFEAKLLNESTAVTNKSFTGKYYLMDFWSTGCKVCIAKRPALEQANELYKGKFEILSLALDKESKVIEFREEKSPMAWKNIVLENAWEATIAKQFEIHKVGLPTTILVSPEGKIIATTDQLTKDNLLKTLSKYVAGEK